MLFAALCCPLVAPRLAAAPSAPAPRNFAAEIGHARAAWNSTSGKIADILVLLRAEADRIRELDTKIEQQQQAIREQERKKKRELEELRNGAFCTGCSKTRSEIEAQGERFPHPGQSIRPATPEELEACRKRHDDRLAQLRQRLAALEQDKNEANKKLGDAYFRFMNLHPVYHRELVAEKDLRLARWRDEAGQLERRLKRTRDDLEAATSALDQATDSADRERLQIQIGVLGRTLTTDTAAARAAHARATQEERDFFQTTQRDLNRLGRLASAIRAVFGIPDGWFIDKVIRGTPPLAYTVYAVYGIDRAADAASSASRLLEGSPAGEVKQAGPASKPSARELLEGK